MDDEGQHLIEDHSDGIPTVPDASEQQATPEQLTDTGAAQPSVEFQQPIAAPPLQILFSVYTAKNGYDWSNIPEGNKRADLDYCYREAVKRKPDFMSPGDVVKGVFAWDNTIAAFHIQVLKHWDVFGRNAEYCAFAFLTYEEACRVDFDALLAKPEFTTKPQHDPPTSISYSGEASKDINSDDSVAAIKKLYNGGSLQSFDFAKIGALLSAHGNKSASWLFCKVECAIENSTTVSTGPWNEDPYPPPPPPPPPSPQPEEAIKVSLSAAQSIAAVVLPEMAPALQPSSTVESSGSRGTVVTDACLRTRTPARSAQAAYRAPATDLIRNAWDETCVLTPVEESNGLFGLDTLTVVLMGLCAVLVVGLLIILFCLFMPRNEPLSFEDAAGVVDVTKDFDGTQIKSLGEERPKTSIGKGDK